MANYYKVVSKLNLIDFENAVSKLIEDGYTVHGPMMIDFTQKIQQFYQPMVKEVSK